MTDFILTNDPAVIGGAEDLTAGRFDATYASRGAAFGNGDTRVQTFPTGEDDLWFQFGHWRQVDTHYYHDTSGYYVNYSDGSTWFRLEALDGIWKVEINDDLGATEYTFPNNDETFEVWDWHFVRDDGAGNATFEFYIDGVLQVSHTGSIGAKVIGDRLQLGSLGDIADVNDVTVLSNMRLSNVSTLDTRFKSIMVDTVGTYDEFVGGGFDALKDYDAATVATSDTAGQRVSGSIPTGEVPAGTITSVALSSRVQAQGPAVNPNSLNHFIRKGSTNYDQAVVTPGAGLLAMVTEMPVNPDTGAAWAAADFTGMEFGLLSVQV